MHPIREFRRIAGQTSIRRARGRALRHWRGSTWRAERIASVPKMALTAALQALRERPVPQAAWAEVEAGLRRWVPSPRWQAALAPQALVPPAQVPALAVVVRPRFAAALARFVAAALQVAAARPEPQPAARAAEAAAES